MKINRKGRILYFGQSFYHAWYLSRELRKLGWKADLLNIDDSKENQFLYHGEDYQFYYSGIRERLNVFYRIFFYIKALFLYDIFHFSNAGYLACFRDFYWLFRKLKIDILFPGRLDIKFLKILGKKIVYSTNGCYDGSLQSSFSKWGPENTCEICATRLRIPVICSDEKNSKWGQIRNSLSDYIVTFDFSPTDYNKSEHVHFHPEFYCMDHYFRTPEILIPANFLLPFSKDTIKILHSVGNFDTRHQGNKTIRGTHIYIEVIERLKKEGYNVELVFLHNVSNKDFRYYQAQVDIVADLLTFGWFGATIREGLMMGKPCVCYIRPEWKEYILKVFPEYSDYINELPVISATSSSVYDVLKYLIENPDYRNEIGKRSRAFAVKWHSAENAAKKFDIIYSKLIN